MSLIHYKTCIAAIKYKSAETSGHRIAAVNQLWINEQRQFCLAFNYDAVKRSRKYSSYSIDNVAVKTCLFKHYFHVIPIMCRCQCFVLLIMQENFAKIRKHMKGCRDNNFIYQHTEHYLYCKCENCLALY